MNKCAVVFCFDAKLIHTGGSDVLLAIIREIYLALFRFHFSLRVTSVELK